MVETFQLLLYLWNRIDACFQILHLLILAITHVLLTQIILPNMLELLSDRIIIHPFPSFHLLDYILLCLGFLRHYRLHSMLTLSIHLCLCPVNFFLWPYLIHINMLFHYISIPHWRLSTLTMHHLRDDRFLYLDKILLFY